MRDIEDLLTSSGSMDAGAIKCSLINQVAEAEENAGELTGNDRPIRQRSVGVVVRPRLQTG